MGHPVGLCAAERHCWCEGAEGPACDLIKSVHTFRSYDLRGIMQVFGPCTTAAVQPAAALKTLTPPRAHAHVWKSPLSCNRMMSLPSLHG